MEAIKALRQLVRRTLQNVVRPGETIPVTFPEANGTLHGRDDVNDLPVCRTTDGNTCSCWKLPIRKRIGLLFTGRVYLVVRGKTHPPLWIDTEAFVRSNPTADRRATEKENANG